jgi:hypothetical protein
MDALRAIEAPGQPAEGADAPSMVGSRSRAAAPQPLQVPASPVDRQRATLLAAQADRARRSATWALATGNWTAAAEWEEQRVISEDQLACLLGERYFDCQPEGSLVTEPEAMGRPPSAPRAASRLPQTRRSRQSD